MSRKRATPVLAASPVLVGAVTVLVAIVAVFIGYNANAGLPFVPTYDVRAEFPSGNKLVAGNEVRAGGFRVGVVDDITPRQVDGRTIAVVSMSLDKTVEPLSVDSRLAIRPRSALGLKYVELTPGVQEKTFEAGATIPVTQATEGLELEDVLSTFGPDTRRNSQAALEGFGDAFASRGTSLNRSIEALNPLFASLTPVMQNLSDPATGLDRFFVELGETTAQVAPVATTQALLFTDMADTFDAISRSPAALRQTIEKGPGTIDTAIRSFRVQRPFLADFADLSRRLRPAVNELPRSLPAINRAFAVGTPVLPRTVALNGRLGDTLGALDDLFANPNTLLAIKDLQSTTRVTQPALEYIAPYQTVCGYAGTFVHLLGEHMSGVAAGGTTQNQGVRLLPQMQPNSYANVIASRPYDTLPGQNPLNAKDQLGNRIGRQYAVPYAPAIDAQGNADCQRGQEGYIRGPVSGDVRYPPGVLSDGTPTGSNGAVIINDFPILSGGTFISRRLGIDNLSDVERVLKGGR